MGNYFKYKIDKVKYKHIKEHNYFEVSGWCGSQNDDSPVSYEVKVNEKPVFFECDLIYRTDILRELKKKNKQLSLGFYIRVDCLEENVENFKLYAKSNGHEERLISLLSDDIKEIEDNHFIEFNIDSVTYEKEISTITSSGWAYSIDAKPIEIRVLDKDKNLVESSYRF